MAHDPTYLDLLLRFLRQPDRTARLRLYRRLAEMTVAPLRPLWVAGETALAFGVDDVSDEMIAEGERFWQSLLGGSGGDAEP